jgi:glyoxylate/hydroxypyruvate reductase
MFLCGMELSGATVGLIGFGRIGQAIVRRLRGFGVGHVLYCDRSRKPDAEASLSATHTSWESMLCKSDVVIASCALSEQTAGRFDYAAFKAMKSSAIFINISRGGVVKQEDLVRALQEKVIWAAGLDVTTPEPLPLDHPLLHLINCVVLPYIGSATYSM